MSVCLRNVLAFFVLSMSIVIVICGMFILLGVLFSFVHKSIMVLSKGG